MKMYKVKNQVLSGNLTKMVTLSGGELRILEVAPADQSKSSESDIVVDDVIHDILAQSILNIDDIILNLTDHTVVSLHKTKPPENPVAYVDAFSRTMNGRMTMLDYSRATKSVIGHLFVPFSGASSEECFIVVPESIGGKTIVEGLEIQDKVFSSFEEAVDYLMPTIQFSNLTIQDGLLVVTVEVKDMVENKPSKPVTVYIESTLGSVLTQRVEVIDGTGTAIVSIAGLPNGIDGKIKAGFRYYPGKCEITFRS